MLFYNHDSNLVGSLIHVSHICAVPYLFLLRFLTLYTGPYLLLRFFTSSIVNKSVFFQKFLCMESFFYFFFISNNHQIENEGQVVLQLRKSRSPNTTATPKYNQNTRGKGHSRHKTTESREVKTPQLRQPGRPSINFSEFPTHVRSIFGCA